MGQTHTGNMQPTLDYEEHQHPDGFNASKRVMIVGLRQPQLSTVTVSTTETLCPTESLKERRSVILYNSSASYDCYIGASGLASGSGILLSAGEKMAIDSESGLTAIAEANYILLNLLELR